MCVCCADDTCSRQLRIALERVIATNRLCAVHRPEVMGVPIVPGLFPLREEAHTTCRAGLKLDFDMLISRTGSRRKRQRAAVKP